MRKAQIRFSFALVITLASFAAVAAGPADLRKMAHEYYQWRDDAYPVATSAAGDHRLDDKLTDYRMPEVLKRRQHVVDLLANVNALDTSGWSKEDRIDRILISGSAQRGGLFRPQVEPGGIRPAALRERMLERHFQLVAEGVCASSHARARRSGATRANAGAAAHRTGKWQIMRLLGRYRDAQGANFRLGAFHDQLLSYGSLPVSVIEWLMFDDDTSIRAALQ